MKFLVISSLLAASSVAQQTAQFTNTSFVGPFTAGQTIPVSWTVGNGLPLTLAISNSTWSHQLFAGQPVLPSTYAWIVDASIGLVSGNYQLDLGQVNGGVTPSPFFSVIIAENVTTTSSTVSAPTALLAPTVTVTYVYWEEECGCHKTSTTVGPMNTSLPALTSSWWDHECGCSKSSMVPVTVLPAANNYTAPAAPSATTIPATTAAPTPQTNTGTAAPATYTGNAIRLGSSVFGMVALIAVAVMV